MLLNAQRASVRPQAAQHRRRLQVPAASAVQQPIISVIPYNGRDEGRAFGGVPPVMGAHLMPSGKAAPLSMSKGPGIDVTPHQFQYLPAEGDATILLHPSKADVGVAVVKAVADAAAASIAAKGSFTLVLSGGSLLGQLSGLAQLKSAQFDKWHIFFVDERNVPHSSSDSTYKGAVDAFLSKVSIPAAHIHAIQQNLSVEQAATQYAGQIISKPEAVLPRREGLPVFDLILLGLGPDGHIASLFPNHPAVAAEEGLVVAVHNSPKPPAERITMTLPVINAAREVVFVATGEDKASVVQRALEVQTLPGALPAQLVRPSNGTLRWFLDQQSASQLSVEKWEDRKAFPRSL